VEKVETQHLFWTDGTSVMTSYETLDIQTSKYAVYHIQQTPTQPLTGNEKNEM